MRTHLSWVIEFERREIYESTKEGRRGSASVLLSSASAIHILGLKTISHVAVKPGVGTYFKPGVVTPILKWAAIALDLGIAWYASCFQFLMQDQ
jgi:hypothetical protein